MVPENLVQVATQYQIEGLHASGGLGRVYIASDAILNRKVAIKFPRWERMSTEQAARFEREAHITGRLDHPGVVPIHALKTDHRGKPFYVMRFVDGQTLQERIQQLHSGFPESGARALFESVAFRQLLQDFVTVCNIVAYAHGQGVIHRDIKPGNIILGPFGEVVLLDWGLARVDGESDFIPATQDSDNGRHFESDSDAFKTREGQILGTPAFASPEQLLGRTSEIEPRSDVYSLGATLFVLLTGASVNCSEALPELLSRLNHGIQRSARDVNKLVPRALDAVCRCAMAIEPGNRYSTAVLLADDVQRFLAGEAVSVNRDSMIVRCGRMVRKRPGLAAASLATVLVATIAAATASLLLGQKNEQLRSNNRQLETAIANSRNANMQAMEALRTLVQDFVTQKFSEQTELSDADRQFLQTIVQQYESFAALKGDNVSSRAIRAEGQLQSGVLLTKLGDEQQARRALEIAEDLYQQLVIESDHIDYRVQLAATLVELGLSLKFRGELQTAEQKVNRGIELLALVLSESTRDDLAVVQELYGSLHELRGELQISSHRKAEALESYSTARLVFEGLRAADPDAGHVTARLASTYRALSDVCGQKGDIGGQEQYSQRALELYRKLIERYPEDRSYCQGFAWACYDRSYSHEFFERTETGINELTEADDVAARLLAKFPLSDEFRGLRASMRIRRASIHMRAGHYFLAEADLLQSIALFEAILDEATDGALSYRQLIKAARMLGLLRDSHGHYVEAESAFRLAIKHTRVFAANYPESAAQAREVDALQIELATVVGHQGRIPEAIEELETWVKNAEESAEHEFTPGQRLRLLRARCGLSQLYIDGKQLTEASEQIEIAARMARAIEEVHASEFDLLEQLPEFHRRISQLFRTIDCNELADLHTNKQLQILKQLAANNPNESYFLVRHVQALTQDAEELAHYKDAARVESQYAEAASISLRAIDRFPEDLSVRRAREELLWAQGHYYFDQHDFAAALQQFEEAISLKSDSKQRPIYAWCLALLMSESAAQEICKIADRNSVSSPELVDFLSACGVAVTNCDSAVDALNLEKAAIAVLRGSVDAGCILRPIALEKLKSRPELDFLHSRADTEQLLTRLSPEKTAP
jgi:serine/threonine protein kinase